MATLSGNKRPQATTNRKRKPVTTRKKQQARARASTRSQREATQRFTARLQGAAKDGVAVALLAVCAFLLLAFFSYAPSDPGWSSSGPEASIGNWMGRGGAWMADVLFSLLGNSALWWPAIFGFAGWRLIRTRIAHFAWDPTALAVRVGGLMLVLLGSCILSAVHFYQPESDLPYNNGGIVGEGLSSVLIDLIGVHGTTLVALALLLGGFPLLSNTSWLGIMDELGKAILRVSRWCGARLGSVRDDLAARRALRHERLEARASAYDTYHAEDDPYHLREQAPERDEPLEARRDDRDEPAYEAYEADEASRPSRWKRLLGLPFMGRASQAKAETADTEREPSLGDDDLAGQDGERRAPRFEIYDERSDGGHDIPWERVEQAPSRRTSDELAQEPETFAPLVAHRDDEPSHHGESDRSRDAAPLRAEAPAAAAVPELRLEEDEENEALRDSRWSATSAVEVEETDAGERLVPTPPAAELEPEVVDPPPPYADVTRRRIPEGFGHQTAAAQDTLAPGAATAPGAKPRIRIGAGEAFGVAAGVAASGHAVAGSAASTDAPVFEPPLVAREDAERALRTERRAPLIEEEPAGARLAAEDDGETPSLGRFSALDDELDETAFDDDDRHRAPELPSAAASRSEPRLDHEDDTDAPRALFETTDAGEEFDAPFTLDDEPVDAVSPRLWTVEHLQNQRPATEFAEPVGEMPSTALLTPAGVSQPSYTQEELDDMAELLEMRLKEYGVKAEVVKISPGPVITQFEIRPAAGVKSSKISNLSKDLARSLLVKSVRVIEVIQGRPTVGIEIPNPTRAMIRLRQVLDTSAYRDAVSPVTIALGQSISGQPVVADLARMPHLLVAGTTGSGKSVGVNAMLISMLLKSTPEQVRMILIDPKMLELSVYDDIPHLLAPVVTDMKEAANSLRWCVAEMERRYKLMSKMGVRNIGGFNDKLDEAHAAGAQVADPLWEPEPWQAGEPHPTLEKLPYIVVVIDEFADMFMIVGKKVEELIARLAQKARAAGIHLVLATQRPSVDVVTGLIKANIPSRIAFQVSSKIDSRTILDQGGAESLLGHGDMLYLSVGAGTPVRVHGAFVDDNEVHRVVEDWKLRGKPEYVEEILSGEVSAEALTGLEAEGDGNSDAEQDALYDEAVAFVTKTQRVSVSSVQRNFKIGYNRASRLVEAMERAGVVSSMGTNGAREVLASPPPRE